MTSPAALTKALSDPSRDTRGLLAIMSHPAVRIPATEWPAEAFEVQEACGIRWDWSDIVRFLGYVERQGDCLIWTGGKSRGKGNKQWYGSFWTKRKTVRAHKFAAVAILGLRPEPGEEVDHRCHNSRCVSCLQPLTQAANQARIRRPKKRHLALARELNITPAEVMSLGEEKILQYEMLVAFANKVNKDVLTGRPDANPATLSGIVCVDDKRLVN